MKVQRKLNFYMYKWLFGVKPYIVAIFFGNNAKNVPNITLSRAFLLSILHSG